MDKLVRYRKAFYEKENDLHHHNKKTNNHTKPSNLLMSYQSMPQQNFSIQEDKKVRPKNNTAAYCEEYGEELMEAQQYQVRPSRFLRNHQIDAMLRAKMLDWMVEVTTSYKFTNKTYFDGVQLMDRYFQAEKDSQVPTKLHITGVISMLIASKMEEVYPIKIKTVYEKIGHRKLPMTELVHMQERIIEVLGYKLNTWGFFDLITLKFAQYSNKKGQPRQVLGQIFSTKMDIEDNCTDVKNQKLKRMEDIASYLGKLALYDYEFFCETSMLLLAQTIVSTVFETMNISVETSFFSSSVLHQF